MRLVFKAGSSNKFWEARVKGYALIVTFGRVGTAGQVKEKRFTSPSSAAEALQKLEQEKRAKGYVPERGAKVDAKAKAAGPKKKAGPLRAFGFSPGYWYNDPTFPFEVCFPEALTADQRLELAPLVKRHLKIALREPWLWSGRWALFFVDAGRSRDAHRACAAVKKAFLGIHQKVPVAELVFLGLRLVGADGTPSPGPFWPSYDFLSDRFYERERSEPAETPKPDPKFEKARR